MLHVFLGLFIAPKCVKSQNQLPFHTIKQGTYRPGLGNLRSTFTFGWLAIFGLIKCLTSFVSLFDIFTWKSAKLRLPDCMSGHHKVVFFLITLTDITSRPPLLRFRLEYLWKPLIGVLSQFDLVFQNTCPSLKPG